MQPGLFLSQVDKIQVKDAKSLHLGKQVETEADVSNQTCIQVYNPQRMKLRSQVSLALACPQDSCWGSK